MQARIEVRTSDLEEPPRWSYDIFASLGRSTDSACFRRWDWHDPYLQPIRGFCRSRPANAIFRAGRSSGQLRRLHSSSLPGGAHLKLPSDSGSFDGFSNSPWSVAQRKVVDSVPAADIASYRTWGHQDRPKPPWPSASGMATSSTRHDSISGSLTGARGEYRPAFVRLGDFVEVHRGHKLALNPSLGHPKRASIRALGCIATPAAERIGEGNCINLNAHALLPREGEEIARGILHAA